MRCATWMFFGPNSRAVACATARRPNFALAKAAYPVPPRKLAVAPGQHREALGGELLCNLAADIVASTDHGHGRVSLLQGCSPGQVRYVVCENSAGRRAGEASLPSPRKDSASVCFSILPVEVAGKTSRITILDGRLYEVS